MIKSTKQYQQYVEIVKQYLAEQHAKNIQGSKGKKKGSSEDEEENEAEEEDDETKEQLNDDEEVDDDNNSDESVSEATAESQHQVTEKPKKKGKDKKSSTKNVVPESESASPASSQSGFMSQVFTKFKSNFAAIVPTLPTVQLPSISNVLPSLPSVPVPKLTLTFTKSNDKKRGENTKITYGSGNSENGKFQFSFAPGKNGEKQRTEHPKFTFAQRPSRFFLRATSTTTKKPLTVGAWGIFG